MSETQNNYLSSISIGGRPIWNLMFADDIDLIAGTNEELQELTDQLARNATRYGMYKKIQTFENKSHRKSLGITYHERIIELLGKYEPLLQTIRRRKLKWFGHVSRHDGLCNTIMQGAVEGIRKQGRPKMNWMDNIVKWTKKDMNILIKDVHERDDWRNYVNLASVIPPTIFESRDNK